jgi:hypothetical protein
MEDKKDKFDRVKYFGELIKNQEERKEFYIQQIEQIKKLRDLNEKEIKYNENWIIFHEKSIKEHEKAIKNTLDLNYKKEQEEKLNFHVSQIKGHHSESINYHKKEVIALEKEMDLFKQGIARCEEQIKYLERKIKENN